MSEPATAPAANRSWRRLADLELRARPSALYGTAILWALLTWIARSFLSLSWPTAIVFGLASSALHILSELWHQLGHARAARKTGYPMQAIEFWWFFGASVYPADEPELPATTHIHRALGGVPFSLILGTAAGFIWAWLSPEIGSLHWLVAFLSLDNVLVFSLGSLMPLGFTDGSTLMRYWNQK